MKISHLDDDNVSEKNLKQKFESFEMDPEVLAKSNSVFRFLNAKDRDVVFLIFISKMRQRMVQKILNRKQPTLCYDIYRIRKRVEFICYLHLVYDAFINFLEHRSKDFSDDDRKLLTLMLHTTSLTTTAKVLGLTSLNVKYWFERAIEKLADLKIWDMYEIFMMIRNNYNIIRRTTLGEIEEEE